MKVFIISDRNSGNSKEFLAGNFTTIIKTRARRWRELNTLLGNNHPKECFIQNNLISESL
jgi:hypothetical protein